MPNSPTHNAGGSCSECEAGPVGIAGHDGLYQEDDSKAVDPACLFRCSRCARAWRRRYGGSGMFTWTAGA